MHIRKPVVAGQFYAETKSECLEEIEYCLAERDFPAKLPGKIFGGIVPHAGWTFSGDLAGAVFSAIKKVERRIDTFVIFGAAHRYMGADAAIFDKGKWSTPIGEVDIDRELAAEITKLDHIISDSQCHVSEHSIEVQIPFIQYLFENAKIVPIMVPPAKSAVQVGRAIGKIISNIPEKKIACIASSDLTHYGPKYGFCPQGVGFEGIKWAKEVNDVEFIELALNMNAVDVLLKSEENMSACGPGAAAALIAAMKELGVEKGILLGHTHSNDVMIRKYGQTSEESVGYAGIVF